MAAPYTLQFRSGETWTTAKDVEVQRVRLGVRSEPDELVAVYRFGVTSRPRGDSGADPATVFAPLTWVRLILEGETLPCFVGRVTQVGTDHHGSPDDTPEGVQTWTAQGPASDLAGVTIRGSYWNSESTLRPQVVAFNDPAYPLGNQRSTLLGDLAFGRDQRWTRHQALQYLVEKVINETGNPDDPPYTIGGQTSLLDEAATEQTPPIAMQYGDTALDVLDRILDASVGLSYRLNPTVTGVEITVFALNAEAASTPWTITETARRRDIEALTLTAATPERYARIVVLGEPVVTVKSYGPTPTATNQLIKGWTTAQQTAYLTAASSEDPTENDAARSDPALANVFSRFVRDDAGPILTALPHIPDIAHWIANPTATDRLREAPIFAAGRFVDPVFAGINGVTGYWSDASTQGISVSPTTDGFGVHLKASPAHRLAWELNDDTTWAGSIQAPTTDYRTMLISLAEEGDFLKATRIADGGNGKTLVLRAPGLRKITVEAGTAYGINADNELLVTSEALSLVDDTARIEREADLAALRYQETRRSLFLRLVGIQPHHARLGQMVDTVTSCAIAHLIWSPVTSVTYDFASLRTELSTGFYA